MPGDAMAYEARFGWNRRNVLVAICGLAALAVAVGSHFGPHPFPLWVSALWGLLGVIVLIAVLAMAANRRVALRADETGLTLVGSPLRPAIMTLHFPWSSIDAIVLWGQDLPDRKGRPSYIGVRLREGAPPVHHDPKTATFWKVARDMAPDGTPPGLADTSVLLGGWRWSPDQLAQAAAHYAPSVAIEQHRY